MRKPPKFVMAPERKIPVFEGKASEIDDFISGINGAFSRYGISEEEKTSYLLDFVRGLPKAEIKALIKDGKSAEDILQFLQDSNPECRSWVSFSDCFCNENNEEENHCGITLLIWSGGLTISVDERRSCILIRTTV